MLGNVKPVKLGDACRSLQGAASHSPFTSLLVSFLSLKIPANVLLVLPNRCQGIQCSFARQVLGPCNIVKDECATLYDSDS